ncbi:MAG: acetyl-CoA C-acyltransferase [Flavobacteriia bacterium]|nr:acetyl-CoA C-acyltransferase [Flavobacteriia bacterium]
MSQEAYIVGGLRSPVGKANRGALRFTRPDDLAAQVLFQLLNQFPQLDTTEIDDLIVGNAMPEAEQGLNVSRLISLIGLKHEKVPGMTINRYCASGLESIALAKAKIESGLADCIIAGGVESMSLIPMGGWRVMPNPKIAKTNPDYYWGMGLTAEEVAKKYDINREDQDQFSLLSNNKALKAIENKHFINQIAPITIEKTFLDENEKLIKTTELFSIDEGPRKSNIEALSKLKPVFASNGSVTAGNSSQTSDGAAFVLLMSERMLNRLKIQPLAKMLSYAVVGVEPRIMGIGPVEAIPKALKMVNKTLADIDLIELNEAFASQSLAVIKQLELNPELINVNGGAIALGHPLACTGSKLSIQLFDELKRRNQKYGIVSMCVGTGQGAAGIFELI